MKKILQKQKKIQKIQEKHRKFKKNMKPPRRGRAPRAVAALFLAVQPSRAPGSLAAVLPNPGQPTEPDWRDLDHLGKP